MYMELIYTYAFIEWELFTNPTLHKHKTLVRIPTIHIILKDMETRRFEFSHFKWGIPSFRIAVSVDIQNWVTLRQVSGFQENGLPR
jgi:hypothetical protein